MKKAYESISFVPPATVAAQAKRGLELREKHGKGGTLVGMRRAHQLADRETLSPQTVKRMHSYFARHEVDKEAEGFTDRTNPSKGKIAWLLWGGDPGKAWADKVVEKMKKADEQ